MLASLVIAAAGLAELTPEESQWFACILALGLAIPFILFNVCYAAFLLVFFRNPIRRHQTNARAVMALLLLWATVGGGLLVPLLPFLPEVLGLLKIK